MRVSPPALKRSGDGVFDQAWQGLSSLLECFAADMSVMLTHLFRVIADLFHNDRCWDAGFVGRTEATEG